MVLFDALFLVSKETKETNAEAETLLQNSDSYHLAIKLKIQH